MIFEELDKSIAVSHYVIRGGRQTDSTTVLSRNINVNVIINCCLGVYKYSFKYKLFNIYIFNIYLSVAIYNIIYLYFIRLCVECQYTKCNEWNYQVGDY